VGTDNLKLFFFGMLFGFGCICALSELGRNVLIFLDEEEAEGKETKIVGGANGGASGFCGGCEALARCDDS
tara:strand:+ start:810 stop:1022 length:213 start_codon:yes stop_codon:yes gene_type:complete